MNRVQDCDDGCACPPVFNRHSCLCNDMEKVIDLLVVVERNFAATLVASHGVVAVLWLVRAFKAKHFRLDDVAVQRIYGTILRLEFLMTTIAACMRGMAGLTLGIQRTRR